MDINYARMWIVHKPVTIKDESCKTNTYKGYIILGHQTIINGISSSVDIQS